VLELIRIFLRLGLTAFGGPAAHIAMMREEFVRQRQWLTEQEFLDMLGFSNLIPGPNSTEMAIHIGYRRAGWPGLIAAGACFILPAVLITAFLASLYVRAGAIPQMAGVLYGVKPVVIAVVVQALWGLGRSALKTMPLVLLGLAAVAMSLWGVNELLILAICGLAAAAPRLGRSPALFAPLLPAAGPTAGLSALFLTFLKIGSILFGSGYVLLAFLRADLVEKTHWLTEGQLLDAVAAGQITPGPVFSTATFVGYVLAGGPGAAAATIGIFLPAFVFVGLGALVMAPLRKSALAAAVLDGVNVGSLALMAVVSWYLARNGIMDVFSAALALLSAILLFRYRVNSAWLVLAGALAGLGAKWWGA
jgi:chromate transporter